MSESTEIPRNTPLVNPSGNFPFEAVYSPTDNFKQQVLDVIKNIQINGQNGQMESGSINFNIEPPPPKASEAFSQLNATPAPAAVHSPTPEIRHAPPKAEDGFDRIMSGPYAGAGQQEKVKPAPPEAGKPVQPSALLENARTDPPNFPQNPPPPEGQSMRHSYDGPGQHSGSGTSMPPPQSHGNGVVDANSRNLDSLKSSTPISFQVWYKGKIGKIMINCDGVPTEK
jgi:hypothetical protein